jgi:hypothetical protein
MQFLQQYCQKSLQLHQAIPSLTQWQVHHLLFSIIIVNKAPAPREVIWNNLHFSYIRSLVFEVLFIVCMLAMLAGALKIILVFMS